MNNTNKWLTPTNKQHQQMNNTNKWTTPANEQQQKMNNTNKRPLLFLLWHKNRTGTTRLQTEPHILLLHTWQLASVLGSTALSELCYISCDVPVSTLAEAYQQPAQEQVSCFNGIFHWLNISLSRLLSGGN